MSLWKIAWRSIQQRSLASLLTAISMALGVALVVAVLVIQSVVYQSFHRGGEGYDLVVGAGKGGRLELVLNAVYYIGRPSGNIAYNDYKNLAETRQRDVRWAIPICLGDTYQDYRVVGTLPALFEELSRLGCLEKEPFAEGDNFSQPMEAVVGAIAANKLGLKVGGTFRPTHDVAGTSGDEHEPFTVVGVLKPTGTPHDRALFIHLDGFYQLAGHVEHPEAKPSDEHHAQGKEHADHDHDHDHEPIPDELKKVTAVLVSTYDEEHPGTIIRLAAEINADKKSSLQAAIPTKEIAGLFENVIGNIELVLLVFAVMIVLVAGIGIMVSIYNSMSDRRHEIAIMRALGASRGTVMAVILLESILLSLGGGLLGLLLAHGAIAAAGPLIADKTGLTMGLLQFRLLELILIPALLVLASVVGYLPAVAAYRTDVAKSLTAAP